MNSQTFLILNVPANHNGPYILSKHSGLLESEKYRLSRQFDKFVHMQSKEQCHIWQCLIDSCGYSEISKQFHGKHVCLKAHRVAFAVAYPLNFLQSTFNDVSHLCHNRLCVNVKHLSLEPHGINNNTFVCINEDECYGHHGFQDCFL